jgi:hypothetical protein
MNCRLTLAAIVLAVIASTTTVSAQGFGPPERDDAFKPDHRSNTGDGDRSHRRPRGQGPRLSLHRFNDVAQAAPIPSAEGAGMCALTMVDDDTSEGFCRVFFDERTGVWMHQTGGPGSANQCEATCLWLSADDRGELPEPSDRQIEWRRGALEAPSSTAACRPPRRYTFTLTEPKALQCVPTQTPVFEVEIPDTGQTLARANIIYANDSDLGTAAIYYWNTGVYVGSANGIQIGADICPRMETAPRPTLGFGYLDQQRNATVRVASMSGAAACVDGAVSVLPGSTLEVWVEDPDAACRGTDVGFASTFPIPAFRSEAGWPWSSEPRKMLSVAIPASAATRSGLTIVSAVEATPRRNPNQVCGAEDMEGASASAALVSSRAGILASQRARFPASQGMGHVVLGVEAQIGPEADRAQDAELWVSTDAPPGADVFTGSCCGEGMIGFVRH